jgi:integrase
VGEDADETAAGRRWDRLGCRAAARGEDDQRGRQPDSGAQDGCAWSQPDHPQIMPRHAGRLVTTRSRPAGGGSHCRPEQLGRYTIAFVSAPRNDLSAEIDAYLLYCLSRGVKLSTIKHSYGYSLVAVLLPWCRQEGITTVAALTQGALERFASAVRARTTRDGSPLTENTVWTYQKAANQLVKWYAELHDTVGAKVRLHQPVGRKVAILERDQIALLERTADTERDRVIVRLLADSGMRAGELVKITKGDLRRGGGRHYVGVGGTTAERYVPITPRMYARLKALSRGGDDEPVFVSLRRDLRTGQREALTVAGVRQMVGALGVNAGVGTTVNPYVFRHSACRWLLMSGESPLIVEKILGRGSEAMIREHYSELGNANAHDRLMQVLRAERS